MKEPFRIEPLADHDVRYIYPPVGFQPWPIGGLGNGDEYGYYWPVGRESTDPLVAMTSQDCWALIPVASSLESLARLGDCEEVNWLVHGEPDGTADESDDEKVTLSWAERLAIDPDSPHLLVANADAAMAKNELDKSESQYLRAIHLLPEYTAAHFGLAMLYRRLRKPELAIRSMLETIRSPLCFQGASFWSETSLPLNRNDYRRKCLMWLQQAKVDDVPSSATDPLFAVRDQLTFATGVKTIDDFALYDQVIEQYTAAGRVLDAIRLLMLVGELMMCETVSFRERSAFTFAAFRGRLLSLFRLGAIERAAFLESAP